VAQHGPDNTLIQCNGFDSSKTEISPMTRRRFHRDNDVDIQADELSRDFGDARGASVRPAILDSDGSIAPMQMMAASANLPAEHFVDYSLVYL
jgi:hypothetical protein